MYSIEDINTIHLEITSRCNASCPLCQRSIHGGRINPNLPITELTIDDIQNILPIDRMKNLNRLFMCGNYGDPAMASDTLEVFEWLRSKKPNMKLEIFSNAGVRPTTFWKNLAKTITKGRFAIDGLEDTNHLYRKGVHWNNVEKNLRSFIEAGGKARWDFIVFRHNEHQVEQARELAFSWGVDEFVIKRTGRFYNHERSYKAMSQAVHNDQGEEIYKIYLPENKEYINPVLLNEKTSDEWDKTTEEGKKNEKEVQSLIESASIACKALQEKAIYISAEGLLLPCCFIGVDTYPWSKKHKQTEFWDTINRIKGGVDTLNAKKHGAEGVLRGEFFQNRLIESWKKPSYAEGKLRRCTKTCGRKDFDILHLQNI